MDESVKDLDALFGEVRDAQDAILGDGADDLDQVASRLRAELEAPRPAPRRAWQPWAAAAALVLAVTGGAAALYRGLATTTVAEPLSWRVDAPSAQTYAGWVATGDAPGRVTFSDGSRLALADATRLRVLDVRTDGATLVLERGEVRARIHHRDTPSWQLHAGPFVVSVRGTTFTTRWDPERGALSVELIEGRVRLGGACLERERDVRTGERVELRCPAPGTEPPVETASALDPPAPLASAGTPSDALAGTARASTDGAGAPRAPELRAAPRRARTEAAADMPATGDAPASEDAREAFRVAQSDAAAGRTAEAIDRLEALRAAHAGTDEAALAAFLLGRLAFDEQRDPGAAARWFRTYLTERSSGTLAREARGRLLEALDALGRADDARAEARIYLERHPGGPHAELARRLAGP